MQLDAMVSHMLGVGAISVTFCQYCDWSIWSYHLAQTCRYIREKYNRPVSFHGDNAPYHTKGIQILHKQLLGQDDDSGAKFLEHCFVRNIKHNYQSNPIENGVFGPLKMRFYYSGLTDSNFTIDKLLALFPNTHSQNLRLAANYLRYLEKMLNLPSK